MLKKLWSRWRSRKPPLSLNLQPPDRSGPSQLLPERLLHIGPHPQNAEGPFYVENGECITCGAPHAVAPDLMGWNEDHSHCFFRKQPSTPGEVDRAIQAIGMSCCGALRYRGDDEDICKRLRLSHSGDSIDRP